MRNKVAKRLRRYAAEQQWPQSMYRRLKRELSRGSVAERLAVKRQMAAGCVS